MSALMLKNTQLIRGFQHRSIEYLKGKIIWHIKRLKMLCPRCGSGKVSPEFLRLRRIQGLPMGTRQTYFEFRVHRIYCYKCRRRNIENFHFLSHPKSRITKSLEKVLLLDRHDMSIRSIAAKYSLRWELIKDLEKQYLERKYAKIQTAHVRQIGIDEIHTGTNRDRTQRYLTIIRDLENGDIIHVGDGKGITALEDALKKLKKSKLKIVAMDMANAYSSWIEKHFPKARIVFDHFHVIKLMNDRLDKLRRRYIAGLDETQRSQFKRLRPLFLRNQEDLDFDSKLILNNMRKHFSMIADAHMFKESLRTIYKTAGDALEARAALRRWATLAEATGTRELVSMAKTIREKLHGIITYWTFNGLSNASTEGFNNKIRWLMRQAYGFRDYSYLKLKIFQLPSLRTQKEL